MLHDKISNGIIQSFYRNMYNRSISFKVLFWKQPHIYVNDVIIDKQSSINKNYGTLLRYNRSMP